MPAVSRQGLSGGRGLRVTLSSAQTTSIYTRICVPDAAVADETMLDTFRSIYLVPYTCPISII